MSPSDREPAPVRRPDRARRFLVAFVVSVVVAEALYLNLVPGTAWFAQTLTWNAHASAGLLRLFGAAAEAEGQALRLGSVDVTVQAGCDPVEPILILWLALLWFPASPGRKVAGALTGAALLAAANLVRIASLCVARVHFPGTFATLHTLVWPLLMILFALGILLAWARVVRERPSPSR
jgi:exosortase/archaeosortase family protein